MRKSRLIKSCGKSKHINKVSRFNLGNFNPQVNKVHNSKRKKRFNLMFIAKFVKVFSFLLETIFQFLRTSIRTRTIQSIWIFTKSLAHSSILVY